MESACCRQAVQVLPSDLAGPDVAEDTSVLGDMRSCEITSSCSATRVRRRKCFRPRTCTSSCRRVFEKHVTLSRDRSKDLPYRYKDAKPAPGKVLTGDPIKDAPFPQYLEGLGMDDDPTFGKHVPLSRDHSDLPSKEEDDAEQEVLKKKAAAKGYGGNYVDKDAHVNSGAETEAPSPEKQ